MVFVFAKAKIPLCHTTVKALPDQWYKIVSERQLSSGELFRRQLTLNSFIAVLP